MVIEFWSRGDMKRMLKANAIDFDKDVVISINDTVYEYDEMSALLAEADPTGLNFTKVVFKDDDEDFGVIQAEIILNFIKKHGQDKNYHVHCFAGISRSGAIAKYIDEYFKAGNRYLKQYKGYNKHVFNTMHKANGTSLAAFYEQLEKQQRGK